MGNGWHTNETVLDIWTADLAFGLLDSDDSTANMIPQYTRIRYLGIFIYLGYIS